MTDTIDVLPVRDDSLKPALAALLIEQRLEEQPDDDHDVWRAQVMADIGTLDRGAVGLVAFRRTVPLGCLLASPDGHRRTYVRPEHAGTGVEAALASALVSRTG